MSRWVTESASCRECGGAIYTGGFTSPDRSRWFHAMGVPEDAHQAVPLTVEEARSVLAEAERVLREAVASDCPQEALDGARQRYWRAVDDLDRLEGR